MTIEAIRGNIMRELNKPDCILENYDFDKNNA
jgi:hypothetical protein